MLLTQEVEVKIRKNTIDYYREKGYECNCKDVVTVSTMDLQPRSDIKVKYKCDECGEIYELRFEDYRKKLNREYASLGEFCNKCNKKIRAKWFQENDPKRYKNNYNKRTEKRKETMLERYGTDNAMRVPEIKNLFKESIIEKYGVDNVMKVQEIKQRCFEKMGLNNELIMIEENGTVYYRYKGIPCSQNQYHIWEVIGGELNSFIDNMYSVDILLDDKIYFEYDGNGHKLSVHFKHMTEEEFEKKEMKRYYTLKGKGYKQIRFISLNKNTLPSDEMLLKLKEISINYLSESDNHWIEFNYDEGYIRTKQNKEYFNFND